MLSIDQIIKGCKKQKADCQKILYQEYFSAMMGICNRYGASVEDAEEMLNNGFLKIFVNINQYQGKGSFEGWMRKIMVNACLDFLRSKQAKQTRLAANPSLIENESNYFDNTLYNQGVFDEIDTEKKYTKDELLRLLNQIPELSKTVFNLVVFEEYSHKEIAALLDIAERTSQWHLSNAKKALAEIILKKNNFNKVAGL